MLTALRDALASDEHVVALRPRLAELEQRALTLLTQAAPVPPTPAPAVAPMPTAAGVRVVGEGRKDNLDRTAAKSVLGEIEAQLEGDESNRLSVAWTVTRKGSPG